MADAVDRDLAFLHGLQKRRLRARGRTVQLVCQKQIAEHRARLIDQLTGLLLVDGITRNIRWQHVRRKLDAAIFQPQCTGKGQCHGRFTDAGDILQQDVPSCKQHGQHPYQHVVLSTYRFFDFLQNSSCLVQAPASLMYIL